MEMPRWLRSVWIWISENKFLTVVHIVAVVLLGFGAMMVCWYWEWLVMGAEGRESGSTTARNLGLVAGGLIAIWVAVWRGVVADRQAKASRDQAQTSWSGLLNQRFQRGSDMMHSEILSRRLTGIHELQNLAEEHPVHYHIKVMELFCAFVRRPTEASAGKGQQRGPERKTNIQDYALGEDVQEIMRAISYRGDLGIALEKKAKIHLNLTGAVLPLAHLPNAKLAGVDLSDAHFYPNNLSVKESSRNVQLLYSRADLSESDLSGAFLFDANLTNVFLYGATLTEAWLTGANLTGASLNRAKGLTQVQLNEAVADSEDPPDLRNAHDAETKDLLKWGGRTPSEPL